MGTAITYVILTLVLGLVFGIFAILFDNKHSVDEKGNIVKESPLDKIKLWITIWGIIFGIRLILYYTVNIFR